MNRSVYLGGAMSCYFNTEQHDYPKKWRDEVKGYVHKYYDDITVISPTDFYQIGKTIINQSQKQCDLILEWSGNRILYL